MSAQPQPGRISRKERVARAAIGMAAAHPERITTEPTAAEWKQLAAWCADLWPHDEYAAIVAEALRRKHPGAEEG